MIEKEIEIQILNNWPRKLVATIVGDLAVHPAIKGPGFAVTHMPTSAHMTKALPWTPPTGFTKEQLIIWAEKVQDNLREDWIILASLTPKNYDVQSDEILDCKERLLNWCRSVKP